MAARPHFIRTATAEANVMQRDQRRDHFGSLARFAEVLGVNCNCTRLGSLASRAESFAPVLQSWRGPCGPMQEHAGIPFAPGVATGGCYGFAGVDSVTVVLLHNDACN